VAAASSNTLMSNGKREIMIDITNHIRRAKERDPDAWALLWEAFGPTLLGLAQRLLGPRWPEKSVSDLIQTTWLRAFLGIEDFRGGTTDEQTTVLFRAWLAIILRRVWSNETRYDGTRQAVRGGPPPAESEVESADQPPSVEFMRTEVQAQICEAMAKLGSAERQVLQLYLLEGLSDSAIAARLGITLNQVRYRREQALQEMRGHLEGRV
jgi:RNA polymerase sigma factor (sigma-70 family)